MVYSNFSSNFPTGLQHFEFVDLTISSNNVNTFPWHILPANSFDYFFFGDRLWFWLTSKLIVSAVFDYIGLHCNWHGSIWPRFLEVVWLDFRMKLPWKYISNSFQWADSLEVKVVGHLRWRMGLDSLDSHRLKRPSGLDSARHILNEILQRIVMLSHEGRWQVYIGQITGVTHKY